MSISGEEVSTVYQVEGYGKVGSLGGERLGGASDFKLQACIIYLHFLALTYLA